MGSRFQGSTPSNMKVQSFFKARVLGIWGMKRVHLGREEAIRRARLGMQGGLGIVRASPPRGV